MERKTVEKYSRLYVEFLRMNETVQRETIKGIVADSDLDYEETKMTLNFFVRRSFLSPSEKLRLYRRLCRCLKSKRDIWCRQNNVLSIYESRRVFR